MVPSFFYPLSLSPFYLFSQNTMSPFQGSTKTKPMSPDEWLKKLENNEEHEDENSPRRVGSQRRRPKTRNGSFFPIFCGIRYKLQVAR